MKTLFVTATNQTEANYYTIWHFFKANKTNVSRIVILSTEYTQKNNFVQNLRDTLTLLQVGTNLDVLIEELHLPDGIEEKSVVAIKDIIMQWIATNNPTSIIFNITGGTKLITIAQDQIATSNRQYDCVYQSRSNNQLVWYNNPSQPLYDISLPEDITARLKARGYELVDTQAFLELPIAQWQYVTQMYKFMTVDLAKVQRITSYLNFVVSQFDIKNVNYPHTVRVDANANYKEMAGWIKTLVNLSTANKNKPFFDIDGSDDQQLAFTFASKDDAEFIAGKWFEVLVGFMLTGHYQSQKTPVDIQLGLRFAHNSDGNEIDVAYLLDGHFYWMECKTVNWTSKKEKSPTTRVNNNLHKLASISKVAGLNSHKFFISLYDIPKQSKTVAQDLNITVITGRELLSFSEALQRTN